MKHIISFISACFILFLFFLSFLPGEDKQETQQVAVYPEEFPPMHLRKGKFLQTGRLFSGSSEMEFVKNITVFPDAVLQGWKHMGPRNAGGRVRAIAVDKRNSNIVLTGGVSGGIFRSTDATGTWNTVTSSEHIRLSSIAQDPRNGHGDTWYATTGELATYADNHILGHGVYKSVDNGVSWTLLASTTGIKNAFLDNPFDIVHRVRVHPKTGDVYLAALAGIYRSQNGGRTFERVLGSPDVRDKFQEGVITSPFFNRNYWFSDVHIAVDGTLYAALQTYPDPATAGGGLFRSATGDASDWVNITPPFFHDNIIRVVIASVPSTPGTVYFACAFYDLSISSTLGRDVHLYRYMKSDSNPDQWNDLSGNLPSHASGGRGTFTQGGYNLALAVHPKNPDIVFLGLVAIFRSTTGFTTPYDVTGKHITDVLVHADCHALVFDPNNPEILYIATDGGINKTVQSSFPGSQQSAHRNLDAYFTLNNNALSIAQCYDISLAGEGVYAGTQDQSAWLGTEKSDQWIQYPGGDVLQTAVSRDGKFLVSDHSGGGINLTPNADPDFETVGLSVDVRYLFDFAFDPSNLYRLVGVDNTKREMYIIDAVNEFIDDPVSEEHSRVIPWGNEVVNGKSFSLSSYPPGTLYLTGFGVSDEFYHRSAKPPFSKVEGLFSSSPVFSRLADNDFPEAEVSDIFINPYRSDQLLVSFFTYTNNKKLLYSDNGGATWHNVTGNLAAKSSTDTGPMVLSTAIVGNGSIFFAGTTSGLFATKKLSGATTEWQRVHPDMIKNHLVTDMEVDRTGRLTIGTYGGGVYRAVYDAGTPPAGFSHPLPPVQMQTDATHTIDLADFTTGAIQRIELLNSKTGLVKVSLNNNMLHLVTGSGEGSGVITVILHAKEDGYGAVESFPVNVYDIAREAQLALSFQPISITTVEISGTLTLTNTGQQDLIVKGGISVSNNIPTYIIKDIPLNRGEMAQRYLIINLRTPPYDYAKVVCRLDKYPYVKSFTISLGDLLIAATFAENSTGVVTDITDDMGRTYMLETPEDGNSHDDDNALFNIDMSTGALTFKDSPDFEDPQDANRNNIYAVEVTVTVGSIVTKTVVRVSVTNVNEPPVVVAEIMNPSLLDTGFGTRVIDLSGTFTDPDAGDMLTFSVSTNSPLVVTATIATTTLTLTEVGGGESVITVTANDGSNTATDEFTVTVNRAPVVTPISDLSLMEGGTEDIDLAVAFMDPDTDALTFTVNSADNVVTAAIAGTTLTLTEVGPGSSDITVTANDGKGGTVSDTFTVTVEMVTGVAEATGGFRAYPNPGSESLTVEPGGTVRIYDFTGRHIYAPVREQSPKKVVLDISGLAGGTYLLKVSGGNTARRLVVE